MAPIISIDDEITSNTHPEMEFVTHLWSMRILHGGRTGELEMLSFMTHRWKGISAQKFATIEPLWLPTTLSIAKMVVFCVVCLFSPVNHVNHQLRSYSNCSGWNYSFFTLPCTLIWSNLFGLASTIKTLPNTKVFWKHLIYQCAAKPENSEVQRHPYKPLNNQGL